MHRALNRLRLPYLRRIHVYIATDSSLHAMRPQYTPSMLLRAYEKLLSMSNLQPKHRQHGMAVQTLGTSDRDPANAAGISGY